MALTTGLAGAGGFGKTMLAARACRDGAGQALLDLTGTQWDQPEARYRNDSLDQIRARLGEEQFDRAYAKGSTLSLDVTIERAASRLMVSATT